jgi:hypothetical protein
MFLLIFTCLLTFIFLFHFFYQLHFSYWFSSIQNKISKINKQAEFYSLTRFIFKVNKVLGFFSILFVFVLKTNFCLSVGVASWFSLLVFKVNGVKNVCFRIFFKIELLLARGKSFFVLFFLKCPFR